MDCRNSNEKASGKRGGGGGEGGEYKQNFTQGTSILAVYNNRDQQLACLLSTLITTILQGNSGEKIEYLV